MEAAVCPSQGGELSGLRLLHRGKWVEMLYRARDYRPVPGFRGKAPFLWPATGRSVAAGRQEAGYVLDGKFYPLADHGFAKELPWRIENRSCDETGAFVTLSLSDSDHTRRHYPFGFRLGVEYRVSRGALEIGYSVRSAEDELFFSIGNHITFRLPFLEGTSPAGVRFFTPATVEIEKTPERVPNGKTRAWTLPGPVALGEIKATQAVSLTGYGEAEPFATLEDPGGLGVRISHRASTVPSQPVILFNLWGNAADGYFSPEPWVGLQNSLNLRQGLIRTRPGEEFRWRIRIERLPAR
jgi:galactose mutarotase-like enzyme